jgi:hypothetical protein
MEKVWIVYEVNYGELVYDIGAVSIYGVFSNEKSAISYAEDLMDEGREYDYIPDGEFYEGKSVQSVPMFFQTMDNWRNYYEIVVECQKVK